MKFAFFLKSSLLFNSLFLLINKTLQLNLKTRTVINAETAVFYYLCLSSHIFVKI